MMLLHIFLYARWNSVFRYNYIRTCVYTYMLLWCLRTCCNILHVYALLNYIIVNVLVLMLCITAYALKELLSSTVDDN